MFRVCLVSDFFHPHLGGVEQHQYSIAQALIARGHRVIVVTGTYPSTSSSTASGARQGVRWLCNGLKVYYCPQLAFHAQASLPTLYAFLPLFRAILLRNRIQLVHAHQATSMLCHECLLHAASLQLRTVYTDHSLFGFSSPSSLHLNKLLSFTLSQTSHCIAVSNCSRENLVLRAGLQPQRVSVIPNAVDTSCFQPPAAGLHPASRQRVTVLVLSRLVYRKGLDLLLDVIPAVCARLPYVDWVIGGDGPKRIRLEEMREARQLQDRVALLGPLQHSAVALQLQQADLFLNASLTEAFCIAILEAVSCGLRVVATRVGGVPEILPQDLIAFVAPLPHDLTEAVVAAVEAVRAERPQEPELRLRRHARVQAMYNWHVVAERTERVYSAVLSERPPSLSERLQRCRQAAGAWAGLLWCLTVLLDALLLRLLDCLRPRQAGDEAEDWPQQAYQTQLRLAHRTHCS